MLEVFTMALISHLPNILSISRIFLAAFLIIDALDHQSSNYFGLVFLVAALTDFFDGFIARVTKSESIYGAILDGYADIALYMAALFCVIFLFPTVLKAYFILLASVVMMQALSWGISYIRFKRITSYHSYTAKAWGIMLFISLSFLFIFKNDIFFGAMLAIGVISIVEDVAITLVLPFWKSGVTDFTMAWRLSRSNQKKN